MLQAAPLAASPVPLLPRDASAPQRHRSSVADMDRPSRGSAREYAPLPEEQQAASLQAALAKREAEVNEC